jgi:uncharacterized membrane protein
MADIDARSGTAIPTGGQIGLAHLIYALHAFSAVTGVMGAAFVLTAFLTGWPSIIAVILNYVNRDAVRGTFLESHFTWQIRTFWFSALWIVVAALFFITVIGIPVAWVVAVVAGLWVLYRIIRGWLALVNNRALPVS